MRRPVSADRNPAGLLEQRLGPPHVGAKFLRRLIGRAAMFVAVAGQLVPRIDQAAYQRAMTFRDPAEREEGAFCFVRLKLVEQPLDARLDPTGQRLPIVA